jgi:hypothetical protein
VVNVTDDLVWEVQDQVQRIAQKVDWLVSQAGGDPAAIGALPVEPGAEDVGTGPVL